MNTQTTKTDSQALHTSETRRGFLRSLVTGSVAATTGLASGLDISPLNYFSNSAIAGELKKKQKRVILLWLAGGASQLETFDPKPGAVTGGPFRAIPTSVPGTHISELMPEIAKRTNKMCIIRSLNTRNADHGGGALLMMRGRANESGGLKYPDLGAVIAKEMGRIDSKVPDYISFYAQTEGRGAAPGDSGFLGSRFAPMHIYEKAVPENMQRMSQLTELDHQQRSDLRELFSKQFSQNRFSSSVNSHNEAYQRVRGIMASEKLFDISQEPDKIRHRYGPTLFGEQALATRRLIEAGVPFVRLARAWWDSHGQNFETHQELVPELDHVLSTLIDDLGERGLLENTLIITLAEFGRTPGINQALGRDHFASAWSCSLTGCGIKGGALYGKTDAKGEKVIDGEIGAARLFATIYSALGINPQKNYHVGSRPVPLTDPGTESIDEVLA